MCICHQKLQQRRTEGPYGVIGEKLAMAKAIINSLLASDSYGRRSQIAAHGKKSLGH